MTGSAARTIGGIATTGGTETMIGGIVGGIFAVGAIVVLLLVLLMLVILNKRRKKRSQGNQINNPTKLVANTALALQWNSSIIATIGEAFLGKVAWVLSSGKGRGEASPKMFQLPPQTI